MPDKPSVCWPILFPFTIPRATAILCAARCEYHPRNHVSLFFSMTSKNSDKNSPFSLFLGVT